MSDTVWTAARRAAVLAEAESWLGTPWGHRMERKGRAVDCVLLVRALLVAGGLLPPAWRPPPYNSLIGLYDPTDTVERAALSLPGLLLERVPVEAGGQFGDLVIFRDGAQAAHLGIVLEEAHVWHSMWRVGVTRTDWALWRHWAKSVVRIVGAQQ